MSSARHVHFACAPDSELDAGLFTGTELFAVVVAAIRNDLERLGNHLGTSLPGHVAELVAIGAHVGHIVSHDKMMLRINGNLHVVANDTGVLATCRHRACVRIGQ